ncbi:MAG TPA: hypothetical protein VMB48_12375 [Steroidobacteraceae bacterium]|nr:hypothetical protein [Steroidobacteraceae bacterium]
MDGRQMAIYHRQMDISVTDFKARCLDVIRTVEKSGNSVTIRRRGRIVARLEPARDTGTQVRPWETLRALGGSVRIAPEESVVRERDFESLR